MSKPIFVNEENVKKFLNWDSTFHAVETALESVYNKRAVQNARTFTKCPTSDTLLLTMPAYLDNDRFGALGCKLVTSTPSNAHLEQPLPTINALIMLFEEKTGILKAIIAGTEVTTWRTAAASAVATKYLKPKTSFEVLAILGAGVQGRIHAIAFQHFFGFKEIRIWNRNTQKAETLVSALNQIYNCQKFKCCQSNEECVRNADVVVTATYARETIVQKEWLKDGVHINAVGAGLVHHSELSESIYLSSHVYTDHWAAAQTELAGLWKLGAELKGEIGGVIAGDVPPPPLDQVTVFQGLGMAAEDCAMARLVYDLFTKESDVEKRVGWEL